MQVLKCLRCCWEWIPRVDGRPFVCPQCKSRYWDENREIKKMQSNWKIINAPSPRISSKSP